MSVAFWSRSVARLSGAASLSAYPVSPRSPSPQTATHAPFLPLPPRPNLILLLWVMGLSAVSLLQSERCFNLPYAERASGVCRAISQVIATPSEGNETSRKRIAL